MVNRDSYRTIEDMNGGPPALDESWWDAVLSEPEVQPEPDEEPPPPPPTPSARQTAQNQRNAEKRVDWELAARLYAQDRICHLKVTGYNRGGLLVCGERIQGFVPVSHLIDLTGDLTEDEQEELLETYVGRSLELKVIECDRPRGRVVFSERAALAESGSRNQLLHTLQDGDCVTGTVTNITDFGVFVDLGGVEGLIHVSELSWGRVRHPADMVGYGQQVRVHVISVDQNRSRVALSLKRMYPNPWETAEERYFPGQVTEAIITSIVPFGAFARLEEGLDGLIHISELAESEEDEIDPSEKLHEGQKLAVRVIHVDAARQRLGLSTRLEDEEEVSV